MMMVMILNIINQNKRIEQHITKGTPLMTLRLSVYMREILYYAVIPRHIVNNTDCYNVPTDGDNGKFNYRSFTNFSSDK